MVHLAQTRPSRVRGSILCVLHRYFSYVSCSGVQSVPSIIRCLESCLSVAHPHFDMVYLVLDPQKRAAYDQHGSDPESRFGAGPSFSTASPGFANGGPFAGGFDGEMSPEDLFNMFFGGGMGPGTFTTFGGGGPSTEPCISHRVFI